VEVAEVVEEVSLAVFYNHKQFTVDGGPLTAASRFLLFAKSAVVATSLK